MDNLENQNTRGPGGNSGTNWTKWGTIATIIAILVSILISKYGVEQYHTGSGDNVAGDKYVNQEAKFSVVGQNGVFVIENNERIYRIKILLRADDGILPTQLCFTASTDSQVKALGPLNQGTSMIEIDAAFKRICISNPTKEIIVGYDLVNKPNNFEIKFE